MSKIQPVTGAKAETAIPQTSAVSSSGFTDTLTSKLKVPSDLNAIFEEAAKKYNVPSALLKAVGKAESDYNIRAVSRCGAQGVMQLMPATARGLGVTDSFDPRQNIMGGAKYLADMLKRYNGDPKLALAAYNAGSNNVDKYNGIPPFKETQNYVVKVMEYAGQEMAVAPAKSRSAAKDSTASKLSKPATSVLSSPTAANYSYNPAEVSPLDSGSSDSFYQNILSGIANFDNFSTDDYLLFIELLKSSLQLSFLTQPLGYEDSTYALGLRGSRYQTLF